MRRKRAIILFACQSFAWFTSKDEVTNRLTANADYGVSIVESFAPPENWLPGQEINKDVYAVNTGNVDAYVEETVSGLLTVTTEKATTELTADSVKLKAAEHYAVEAGAYLAYKPAASNLELGTMVVAMVPDSTDLNGYTTADAITDFTPDAAGLYVFRRSIGVDPETKIETFKYDGYYFDGQDYYKLSNLSVLPDSVSYAGDDVTTDGNLTSATAGFYEEETKTVTPTLTYDATNKRLVASYVTVTSGNIQSFSLAYDMALQNFEFASEKYKAALRDDGVADAEVVDKNAALQEKIDALLAAEKTQKEKADALAAAQTAKEKADAAAQAAVTAVTNAQAAKDTADAALATATTNKGTAQSEFNTAQSTLNYLINTQLVGAQTAFNNYKEQNPDVETWFRNYVILMDENI